MVTDLLIIGAQLTQDIQVIKSIRRAWGKNLKMIFPQALNSLKALFDIVYKRFVH